MLKFLGFIFLILILYFLFQIIYYIALPLFLLYRQQNRAQQRPFRHRPGEKSRNASYRKKTTNSKETIIDGKPTKNISHKVQRVDVVPETDSHDKSKSEE